ncbi:MAG: nucleoside recognition domain-containing protein [Alphaproteobacteria bacterium]
MNLVFIAIVFSAFTVTAVKQFLWIPSGSEQSPMDILGLEMINTAGSAVTLAIGLIGVMSLFLGMMKIAEEGGLLKIIAKLLRPLMIKLFPEVPSNHPAMGAMIMNISANVLGLGNAATPFGIKAMQELDKLNPEKGTATNAMALFLAINTSSVTLLPTGIIALRAAAGSHNPAAIVPTTLFATICSTAIAIITAKLLEKKSKKSFATNDAKNVAALDDANLKNNDENDAYPFWVSSLTIIIMMALVPLTVIYGNHIAPWIVPSIMVLLMTFGLCKGVKIYETFVEGAKDGFNVALKIIPYLVVILVAIAMFRVSGALDALIIPLGKITEPLGLPAEALPMALMRPLSGSGAYGIVADILNNPQIGPDSYVGYLVSTFQGSTETTFYVLALYFGSVQIKRVRHALAAALCADLAGVIAATAACYFLFGYLIK